MKTATIPSLRVDPELRQAAESVLRANETLSGFVEQAIRDGISRRKTQSEFIARGLAARDESARTGAYHDADEVLAELDAMLSATEAGGQADR